MSSPKRVQAPLDMQATHTERPDLDRTLDGLTGVLMPLPVKQWAQNMNLAARAHTNASKRLLDLVLQARIEGYDPDIVSETVRDAFIASGCTEQSAKMRAAEAKAIVNMPDSVIDVATGGSVQTLASSARRIAKEAGVVRGRVVTDKSLDVLVATLATLASDHVANPTVASLVRDLSEMVADLRQELAACS